MDANKKLLETIWQARKEIWLGTADNKYIEVLLLRDAADSMWLRAVDYVYGDKLLSWTWHSPHGECTLSNGDHYE